MQLNNEPGLRIPNMFDAAVDGAFKGLYVQGEDILQSDPDTKHVSAGLDAMECVVVQDLFLNETANYAHVFLPGSTFLEKDGTFTNAERRIQRVRRVMTPQGRLRRLGSDAALRQRAGLPIGLRASVRNHGRDRAADARPSPASPTHKLDDVGSVQWPCNDAAPDGTPIMHVDRFVRGKGKFIITEYVPTDERTGPRFPLLLTTGRILSQYNVGAQTRRTENNQLASRRRAGNPSASTPNSAASRDGDWVRVQSRAGETTLHAKITDRVAPGVVYTTFHHPCARPMSSPPNIRIGRRTAPNTR